jgi:hypothetical protein
MAKARVEKRQTLFTKYEFEIGVLTLPVYLTLLIVGLVIIDTRPGIAFAILGLVGLIASTFSIVNGYKSVKW